MLNNDTTLYLLSNIDINEEHQIDFDSETAQSTYFLDKKVATLINSENNLDFKYIKDNNSINVGFFIDDLMDVNYVMYKNNDKWYYEKITQKEYINPNTTKLTLKLDVYQTFMFDFSLGESFVEREHQDRWKLDLISNKLIPIYNLEPENIEKGEQFILKDTKKIVDDIPAILKEKFPTQLDNTIQLFWVYIIASEDLCTEYYNSNNESKTTRPATNNGMPTNVYAYVAPLMLDLQYADGGVTVGLNLFEMTNLTIPPILPRKIYKALDYSSIKSLSEDTKVISMSISRYCPFSYDVEYKPHEGGLVEYLFYQTAEPALWATAGSILLGKYGDYGLFNLRSFHFDMNKNLELPRDERINVNSLDITQNANINYEPKLKTNQFMYYELSTGNRNIKLNNEDFLPNEMIFQLKASFSVKNGQAIAPLHYKGLEFAKTDMLTYDSITNELPLRTDAWKNYLATNKNSMITGFTTNAIQTIGGIGLGILTGGVGLAVAGGQALNYAGQVANKIAQINDIKNTPDKIEKTTLDTTLDYAIDDIYFKLNKYEIRDTFKKKIYNYFNHYGYKCNDFKTSNIRSRYYFNYVKTIEANIKSNISRDYIAELENMFNNGVTIWHYRDATTFKGMRNYEYENVEMALMPTT